MVACNRFRGRVGGSIFLNAMARVRVERSPRCLWGTLGRFLGHGRQEGAWGTPVTRRKENDASYEGGSSRLKFGPLTRSARCDRTGAITTPRFRVPVFPCRLRPAHRGITTRPFRVPVPERGDRRTWAGDTASVESAADHDGRIRPAMWRGESARRMSKCESARPKCECRFPITMANPPGEVSRPIAMRESARRMSKCARLCGVANPPGSHRAQKSASLETATLSAGEGGECRPGLANFLSPAAWRVCYLSFAVGCETYDKPLWLAFSCL